MVRVVPVRVFQIKIFKILTADLQYEYERFSVSSKVLLPRPVPRRNFWKVILRQGCLVILVILFAVATLELLNRFLKI